MDTFGSSPNHNRALIRDTLSTSGQTVNKQPNSSIIPKALLKESKDSVSISSRDITSIVSTLKANNVTDIQAIKDYVSTKETSGNFGYQNLTDHQWSKLVATVRNNIAENLAEAIYNTKQNNKLVEITAKEKAHIDTILSNIRNSQVTNITQAIDLVQSHSSDNPGLLSKISGRLINIVQSNNGNQQSSLNALKNDSYTPAFAMDPNKFTNPFKSDIITRNNQPRTTTESKEFLREVLSNPQQRQQLLGANANTVDVSNLILSNYLRGKNPNLLPEDLAKSNMRQMAVEDQIWHNEKMTHRNVSFINDVAAKIAANKAKTIISCRIAGEIAGAATGSLGMASLVGTSPLIGIMGALAMTLIATIIGFAIGKVAGEGLGKVITNTSMELATPEEYEKYKKELEELEERRERQKREAQEEEFEEDEEQEDNDLDEDESQTFSTNFFNSIDTKVSNALKTKILYKKK
ncbi:MAG: hypothetical protein AB1782_08095 [Cyanobacteriota bacterium]